MGREIRELTLSVSLSRHNSDNDDIDDKLWEELKARVRGIVHDSKYERIYADLY